MFESENYTMLTGNRDRDMIPAAAAAGMTRIPAAAAGRSHHLVYYEQYQDTREKDYSKAGNYLRSSRPTIFMHNFKNQQNEMMPSN